jgi:L-threonylcarbamoyladenylate synthase
MEVLRIDPLEPDPASIAHAAEVLRLGGVVAYPTDTLYGLAVDPRQDAAVDRLFEIKGRNVELAVPLVAASLEQARRAGRFAPTDLRLARRFWPGPLTLVVPAQHGLPARLLAGGTTVAVRVPAHAVARSLAAAFGYAVTATSANLSGQPAASTAGEVIATLGSEVDLLLDAGAAPGGPPSTIVEVTSHAVRLRRAGAIAWERVLESLG